MHVAQIISVQDSDPPVYLVLTEDGALLLSTINYAEAEALLLTLERRHAGLQKMEDL